VLPDDVALTVTIEVGDLLDTPAGAGTHEKSAAAEAQPVHEQMAVLPSVCCQTMSLLPSPLKSPI
jgi:hypothetical protein